MNFLHSLAAMNKEECMHGLNKIHTLKEARTRSEVESQVSFIPLDPMTMAAPPNICIWSVRCNPTNFSGNDGKLFDTPEPELSSANANLWCKVHDGLTRKKIATLENSTIIRNIWPFI